MIINNHKNNPRNIFYLCSKHSNPAKDHKDYEGKLYVDRYWRSILSTGTDTAWLIGKVEQFITKNNITTVQKIVGAPVYLTTRPYCKHFFKEIDVYTALTQDLTSLTPVIKTRRKKKRSTKEFLKKELNL